MTTDTDEPQHRAYHQPDPDSVELRDLEGEDGTFVVRMPIVSTGEVRNEGDEPLTRDEIEGMARQIEERSIGVFIDHGSNMDVAGSRYSATGKIGEWEAPEVAERGDTDVVEADARLMDPETLPAAAGSVREALAAIKSQVERNMSLSSSIGWRDDDSFPGGVDLMEASIVGIPADPRTTSQNAAAEMARAALATREDADPEQLVADFRAVVMGPDERDMTDDTEAGEDPGTEHDEQPEEGDTRDTPEWADRMIDLLEDVHSAVREDDMDDDEDDDDDEENENAADTDTDADPDDTPDEAQSITVGDEELTADDVRALREQLADATPDTGEADADADDSDERDATDDTESESTRDTTSDLLYPRE